MTPLICI